MLSLLCPKNSLNLSNEQLVERRAENVQWQYFSGMAYCEPRLPCNPTQIGRFRRPLREDGTEPLLLAAIDNAVQIKAVKPVSSDVIQVCRAVRDGHTPSEHVPAVGDEAGRRLTQTVAVAAQHWLTIAGASVRLPGLVLGWLL